MLGGQGVVFLYAKGSSPVLPIKYTHRVWEFPQAKP